MDELLKILRKNGQPFLDHEQNELSIGDTVVMINGANRSARVYLSKIIKQTPANVYTEHGLVPKTYYGSCRILKLKGHVEG